MRKYITALSLTAIAVGAGAVWSTVTGADARALSCGGGLAHVRAAFEIARGADYRLHLPAAPDLPELDAAEDPAYVVILDGPLTLPTVGMYSGPAPTYKWAVCVLINGVQSYYPELDVAGITP